MKRSLLLLFVLAVGLGCSLVWAGVPPDLGTMSVSPDQAIDQSEPALWNADVCTPCEAGIVCSLPTEPPDCRSEITLFRTFPILQSSGIPPCEPAKITPCEPTVRSSPCDPACDFQRETRRQFARPITRSPLFQGRWKNQNKLGRLIVRRAS
jgi:hypothetical protein